MRPPIRRSLSLSFVPPGQVMPSSATIFCHFFRSIMLSVSSMAQIHEMGTGVPGPAQAPHLAAELIFDADTISPGGPVMSRCLCRPAGPSLGKMRTTSSSRSMIANGLLCLISISPCLIENACISMCQPTVLDRMSLPFPMHRYIGAPEAVSHRNALGYSPRCGEEMRESTKGASSAWILRSPMKSFAVLLAVLLGAG